MVELPEVPTITLQLFFLCRSAKRNRQQFGNRPGKLLALQIRVSAGRAAAAVRPGIDTVVINTISIERAYGQSDHLKSVQTKTARKNRTAFE